MLHSCTKESTGYVYCALVSMAKVNDDVNNEVTIEKMKTDIVHRNI